MTKCKIESGSYCHKVHCNILIPYTTYMIVNLKLVLNKF